MNKLVEVMKFLLKQDAVKVMYSIYQQIWKTQQWPQDRKRSVFVPVPKKGSPKVQQFKLPHNCTHLTRQQSNAQNSPSEASTVCEPRTSRCSSQIQKRQRNQRLNCQHPVDHQKKAREFQKNIYFCFIDYAKAFDCMDHDKLENSSRDGNTRPPYLPPEKSACSSRSNSQNQIWNTTDRFQIGKGVCQGGILSPCFI